MSTFKLLSDIWKVLELIVFQSSIQHITVVSVGHVFTRVLLSTHDPQIFLRERNPVRVLQL